MSLKPRNDNQLTVGSRIYVRYPMSDAFTFYLFLYALAFLFTSGFYKKLHMDTHAKNYLFYRKRIEIISIVTLNCYQPIAHLRLTNGKQSRYILFSYRKNKNNFVWKK